MAKWLDDLYKEYMEEELEEAPSACSQQTAPVIGGIYFGSLKSIDENKPNKPLYFLVIDKIDDNLYEVLKVSDHYEFATNIDVILDIGTMKVIVETDNNFYLTSSEINNFVLIHKVPEQELHKILAFRDGDVLEGIKTGVTPIFDEDIRNKFKQEEFNQIKDFHMRIFVFLAEPEDEYEDD
jgi:hypothetical protein